MNTKYNCVLLESKLEDENQIKRSYKAGNCFINVTSIFNAENHIKSLLFETIQNDLQNKFKKLQNS